MDFTEAEQRFRFLEDQRARGVLTMEQYRSELSKIRVSDAWGRTWMMQEQTGAWHVYHEGRWVRAEPPVQDHAQPSVPPPPGPSMNRSTGAVQMGETMAEAGGTPVSAQPRVQAQSRRQPEAEGRGCGIKALLYLGGWFLVWAAIAVVVLLVLEDQALAGLAGVALAAGISLVALIATLLSGWEGQIVDIKTERVRVNDEYETRYEQRRYAYVRRSSGKTKKMQAMKRWRVGDRLVKRRGEGRIRHYPRA